MYKFLFCFFTCLVFFGCKKTEVKYFESMDTFMKVQCYGKNPEAANDLAQKKIGELNVLISVTNPQSEIYKINNFIDNLLKGASGQAVQNMNLMFGLEEKEGLRLKGVAF